MERRGFSIVRLDSALCSVFILMTLLSELICGGIVIPETVITNYIACYF
jgi:hypothetical protein